MTYQNTHGSIWDSDKVLFIPSIIRYISETRMSDMVKLNGNPLIRDQYHVIINLLTRLNSIESKRITVRDLAEVTDAEEYLHNAICDPRTEFLSIGMTDDFIKSQNSILTSEDNFKLMVTYIHELEIILNYLRYDENVKLKTDIPAVCPYKFSLKINGVEVNDSISMELIIRVASFRLGYISSISISPLSIPLVDSAFSE